MPVKVLIVEDEFSIALDIEQRLLKMGYNVVGIADSYNEALSFLLENEIDIALLDVNLEDEKTGIDLGKLILKKFTLPIVFITAYTDQRTFDMAMDADPMGYISKPIKDADLNNAIKLALSKFQRQNQPEEDLVNSGNENDFFVKEKGVLLKIERKDILWIEAMDNYTILHTSSGKHIVNSFLKDVLQKLSPYFIRVHRSHAVAKDKITSIEDNLLYIEKTPVVISKSYKQELLKELNLL